jgi:hypothetical protein
MRKRKATQVTAMFAASLTAAVGLSVLGTVSLVRGGVSALGTTAAQLSITSATCPVDIVQDGSGQTLQSPSADCQSALPSLLPIFPPGTEKANSPFFAMPFAGSERAADLPSMYARPEIEGVFSRIANQQPEQSGASSSTRIGPVMTGIGLAFVATAVGVDIALFELRYSRAFMKLTHTHTVGRIIKK